MREDLAPLVAAIAVLTLLTLWVAFIWGMFVYAHPIVGCVLVAFSIAAVATPLFVLEDD